MRVIITDDEELARTRLRRLLEEIGGAEVVGEAANGVEAITLYNKFKPDVILLDIRMPGMDGLEAARHLASLENVPAVVFTTAYGDHALSAFDANAVDYLLKPIRKDRLSTALEKARRLTQVQVQAVKKVGGGAQVRTHICAHVQDSLQLVAIKDILYFLADQKYVAVQYHDGQVLIEESLRSLEQEFDGMFIRIHRNALISNKLLKGIEKNKAGHHCVILSGTDERLEISRRHVPRIRKKISDMGK